MSKSPIVSSCKQTRSNALSSTSPTVNSTEKGQKDQNDLDERTRNVESKGSEAVANNYKPNNVYDGITNVHLSGLVQGIEPKGSGTESNSRTVHQYKKTTLRSKKKNEGSLTEGRTMFSRVAKQGLLALGRGNDETYCSGSEKYVFPVVLVGIKKRLEKNVK